jgi:two-component system NtrC family sensor kinase
MDNIEFDGSALLSLGISLLVLNAARKFLQLPTRLPAWDRYFDTVRYGVLGFFILCLFEPFNELEDLGWVGIFGLLIATTYQTRDYRPARLLLWGLLPFGVLYPALKLIKWAAPAFAKEHDDLFGAAFIISATWLVALWFFARNQRRTLEQERLVREAKEERMRAENALLEGLVAERTAELKRQNEALEETLEELRATQDQLIHSEKMASLGELTAGIAHEIQNPLNFVNNFSEVSVELLDELEEELAAGRADEVRAIADDLRQNLRKITHHGQRADGIVKGMLQHSRASTGQKEPTDLNTLADEYLRLAYHGLRAKDKSFNASFTADLDPALGKVPVIPQELGRVLLNLLTNAFHAVQQRQKAGTSAGYQPTVTVQTRRLPEGVEIRVRDNGTGIPEAVRDKIFQPFFTTKPTGQGTGLGLSLSYDIVTKGHGGTLSVESQEGAGTEFVVRIPA